MGIRARDWGEAIMLRQNYIVCFLLSSGLSCFPTRLLAQDQVQEPPRIIAAQPDNAITTPGAKVTVIGANFPADATVYCGGLRARTTTVLNSGAMQMVTPYLRPGSYKLDLKFGSAVIHSDATFTVQPAEVDAKIDQAEALVHEKRIEAALGVFESISSTDPDYDVRAYAHYRAAQLYLALGDYWAAGEQAGLVWDPKVSMGVQSSWQYRLLSDQLTYAISRGDQNTDFAVADGDIKWDLTESAEPRFWRALISARFGKMEQAKSDLKFILAADGENAAYKALGAYIAALQGDKAALDAFRSQSAKVTDWRALRLLGQAAYMLGDRQLAQEWWGALPKEAVVWAKLDYLAGDKHVAYGQLRVGAALLAECAAVTPDSREGKQAKELLAKLET
ncbi:MAG TPA: IPT/TIG domain-containing protein [Terriglobia bacterium]|nr:IPT/TIG domain-containing protein [Terriglobia bacterium]